MIVFCQLIFFPRLAAYHLFAKLSDKFGLSGFAFCTIMYNSYLAGMADGAGGTCNLQ